jgi:hypothetical protein
MSQLVTTFEEACARLNRSTTLPDVSAWPEKQQSREIAAFKLDAILEVNNEGWEADIANTKQKKWYPVFEIMPDESASGGFRLAFHVYGYVRDYSYLGVRHACKDASLAQFMAENCADVYKELNR